MDHRGLGYLDWVGLGWLVGRMVGIQDEKRGKRGKIMDGSTKGKGPRKWTQGRKVGYQLLVDWIDPVLVLARGIHLFVNLEYAGRAFFFPLKIRFFLHFSLSLFLYHCQLGLSSFQFSIRFNSFFFFVICFVFYLGRRNANSKSSRAVPSLCKFICFICISKLMFDTEIPNKSNTTDTIHSYSRRIQSQVLTTDSRSATGFVTNPPRSHSPATDGITQCQVGEA